MGANKSDGVKPAVRPVLVVEDDDRVSRALVRSVRRWREAEVITTVAEAKKAFTSRGPFGGAIVDLGLPDGSGLDVLAFIREIHPALPVLILTGQLERVLVNRVHVLRGDYLCKPVTLSELGPFMQRVGAHEQLEHRILEDHVVAFAQHAELTPRETEILSYAIAGRDRADAARELGIAENTVKCEIRSLLRKTGERSLANLGRKVLHEAWQRTVSGAVR